MIIHDGLIHNARQRVLPWFWSEGAWLLIAMQEEGIEVADEVAARVSDWGLSRCRCSLKLVVAPTTQF
jgi:hypothetical protein